MSVVAVLCSHSRLFTLGWMRQLKREQARRERESELLHPFTLHPFNGFFQDNLGKLAPERQHRSGFY